MKLPQGNKLKNVQIHFGFWDIFLYSFSLFKPYYSKNLSKKNKLKL